jgi:hypothetical protein
MADPGPIVSPGGPGHNRAVARRRVGSNQYQDRWGPDLCAPDRDLGVPKSAPERRRCGQIWGGRCRCWVRPPDYTHGEHPPPEARWARARDPACPPAVLQALARDPSWRVRRLVARNPASLPQVLATLAGDPDPGVRQVVASNRACPPGALEQLAGDPNEWVRWAVARNPASPPGALGRLARDPNEQVRIRAQEHPRCPPHWGAMDQL